MTTLALPIGSRSVDIAGRQVVFPGIVGFFFVFRDCLHFLFFQSDLVLGSAIIFAINCALLFCTVLYSASGRAHNRTHLLQIPSLQWILAYLALSILSVSWTGAQSALTAVAYWAGMTIDILIVVLLLRHDDDSLRHAEGILKGVVLGAAAISLIAWCSPRTADLRLGNEFFLHPNMLGWQVAMATLIAQYLAPRGSRWRWLGIALAITLLRTLSKTSIIAFTLAECWYLMWTKRMTSRAKLRICAAALVVIACFLPLLTSYISAYNNTGSGNQAETLTGRTVIWVVALNMSLDKPWLGHGFYSFRFLVPAFGVFEPREAHNELLQQFFEYGLVGTVMVVGTYLSFYRQVRQAPVNELRTLALNVLLFALIHGLADAVTFGLSFPLWLMAGFSIVLSRSQVMEAHAS